MNKPGPRFWEIFFEVYENLPRQGPGNRSCAAGALGLCRELRVALTGKLTAAPEARDVFAGFAVI